jgi:heptaprenyl diphosphate synthase
MLYALAETGPDADRLRVLLSRPLTDDGEVAEALELLRCGKGLIRAKEFLAQQAAEARAELAKLPACPAADALDALTTSTIDRTS